MLAIVIPYYNFFFFEETIKSLSLQTNKDFNVYIGDDASQICPLEIINKHRGALNVKYKRFNSNLGKRSLTKHWDRCISLIDYEEWIMLLGDDDVLDVNCIAQFYANINEVEKLNINLVRFSSVVIDSENKYCSTVFRHPKIEKATDSYYRRFKNQTRSSLSEYIFKTSTYHKYKFFNFPLGWHADDMAWLDFTNGGFVFTINDAEVFIRLSENSISGQAENFRKKHQATYLFFQSLIASKLKYFTEKQQIELLDFFRNTVFKREKLSLKNWYIIFYNLVKLKKITPAVKFTYKFLKNKLK